MVRQLSDCVRKQHNGDGDTVMTVMWWQQAGAKSTAASSLKFQAEATAHLQKSGVACTLDAPKYKDKPVEVSLHCL